MSVGYITIRILLYALATVVYIKIYELCWLVLKAYMSINLYDGQVQG